MANIQSPMRSVTRPPVGDIWGEQSSFSSFEGYTADFDFRRTELIVETGGVVSSILSADGNYTATASGSNILTNSATINGHNVLEFDGASALQFGTVATLKSFHAGTSANEFGGGTRYMVVLDDTAAANDYRILGGTTPFVSGVERGFIMLKENRVVVGENALRMLVGNGAATVAIADSADDTFPVSTALVIAFRFIDQAGTDLMGQINLTEVIDANKTGAAVSTGDAVNAPTIGGTPALTNGWKGCIARSIDYTEYHSDAVVNEIIAQLMAIYGVS